MTAAVSAAVPNKSKLGRYILYRLERMKYFTLLMCVFSFISYPLYLLLTRNYVEAGIRAETLMSDFEAEEIARRARETVSGLGSTCLVIGIVGIGMLTALSVFLNFRYMFSKKYVNMDMTLPLSFNERFFGDTAVSFITTFIPHFLGVIIGSLISAGIRATEVPEGVEILNNTAFLDVIEQVMHIGIFIVFLEFFSLLFIGSLCGRVLSTLVHWIILNCTVPACVLLNSMLAMLTAYGCEDDYSVSIESMLLLEVSSPLGLGLSFRRERDIFMFPLEMILVTVFVLLLAVGSYLLMKHRRMERTGETYAYKYARHILVGAHLAAAAIYFLCPIIAGKSKAQMMWLYPDYYSDFYNGIVIWWIVISVVIVFIGEVTDTARFRNILRTVVCSLISVGAGALFCLISVISDGYGSVTYIPAEEDTAVVSVTLTNTYDRLRSYDIPYSQVTDLHRKILGIRPGTSGQRMISYLPEVQIEYLEKGARRTYRSYVVDDALAKEALELLWSNGAFESEYKMQRIYSRNTLTGEYEIMNEFTPTKVYFYNESAPWKNEDDRNIEIDVSGAEVMAAMQQDARETTFEQLYRSPYGQYAYIGIDYLGARYDSRTSFKIYPFFTHTLDLLSAHGFDLSQYMLEVTDAFLVRVDDPVNKVEDETSASYDWGLRADSEFDYTRSYRRVDVTGDEFEKLSALSADRTMYYGTDPRYYMIYIRKYYEYNNVRYYTTCQPVPELCTADAAALWDKLQPASAEEVNYYRYGEYIDDPGAGYEYYADTEEWVMH